MFISKKKVVALAASVAVLAITATSFTPAQAAPKNQARAVVQADWLEKNLDDPKVVVVEVSTEPGIYERGHIRNSVKIAWHTDLVDTVNRDVVSAANFQKFAQAAGISQDTTVVLYGDKNNWFAAWGAWVFDVYGVDNVKLLDGGRVKWEAEKRALDNRAKTPVAGNVTVKAANKDLRAFLPDVLAAAEKRSDVQLVDIRSADEYNGKVFAPQGVQELAVRAGHVPGAVNVPWGQAVAADGTFKSVAELKKVYGAVGIDGSKPIITYCRIGERSSHTWFALKKILGYDVRNYDGSWTEYGNAVGVPVVNVAGTVWGGK